MCTNQSSKYINVLLGLGLVFGLVSLILGVLTFGLPFFNHFEWWQFTGFFQSCNYRLTNCSYIQQEKMNISAFSLFLVGIVFNFVSVLLVIIYIIISNKKYVLIYMRLSVRAVTAFLLTVADCGYFIAMVIKTVSMRNSNTSIHAMFCVGWITFGFSVLATFMIMLSLCGKCIMFHHGQKEAVIISHTNNAYEKESKLQLDVDVNKDIYRMYARN